MKYQLFINKKQGNHPIKIVIVVKLTKREFDLNPSSFKFDGPDRLLWTFMFERSRLVSYQKITMREVLNPDWFDDFTRKLKEYFSSLWRDAPIKWKFEKEIDIIEETIVSTIMSKENPVINPPYDGYEAASRVSDAERDFPTRVRQSRGRSNGIDWDVVERCSTLDLS